MKKIDHFLQQIPKPLLVAWILSCTLLILYVDIITGPQLPLTILYVGLVFVSLKYLGSRYAYAYVLLIALGKTYVKLVTYPTPAPMLLHVWQFCSSTMLYSTLCYLLDAQMKRRKEAEIALSELAQLHRSIIAETDSGIMAFNSDGSCILANDACAKIIGCAPAQLPETNFRKISAWQNSGLLEASENVLRHGQTKRINACLHSDSGKDVWCIVSIGRIDRIAAPPCLLVVFSDISAYREAVLEAQQANSRASMAERRILNISEETQQRIGQELHDDLGQQLTGIAFMSQVLSQNLKTQDHPSVNDASRITALINDAISKTRTLAYGLYPVEMREAGLAAMLRNLTNSVESIYKIRCEFICAEECQIKDPLVVINLFRICQEAINNAIKHSNATGITLKMESIQSIIHLEIIDNGCGIADSSSSGLGMHTMRYRASLLGTTLRIRNLPAGGTSIAVSLATQQDILQHAA